MFLCKKCATKRKLNTLVFVIAIERSNGQCEDCKEVKICVDYDLKNTSGLHILGMVEPREGMVEVKMSIQKKERDKMCNICHPLRQECKDIILKKCIYCDEYKPPCRWCDCEGAQISMKLFNSYMDWRGLIRERMDLWHDRRVK
jgi:DNA-binding cell septation regulator SpoVG